MPMGVACCKHNWLPSTHLRLCDRAVFSYQNQNHQSYDSISQILLLKIILSQILVIIISLSDYFLFEDYCSLRFDYSKFYLKILFFNYYQFHFLHRLLILVIKNIIYSFLLLIIIFYLDINCYSCVSLSFYLDIRSSNRMLASMLLAYYQILLSKFYHSFELNILINSNKAGCRPNWQPTTHTSMLASMRTHAQDHLHEALSPLPSAEAPSRRHDGRSLLQALVVATYTPALAMDEEILGLQTSPAAGIRASLLAIGTPPRLNLRQPKRAPSEAQANNTCEGSLLAYYQVPSLLQA